jgi:two-component system, probable response regulator PhcQ
MSAPVGGVGIILLAEDDVMVRGLMARILSGWGHTVIEAVDGVDAVSKFREVLDRLNIDFQERSIMKNTILLVDDEANVLSALQRALFDEPFEVLTAISGEEGLKQLLAHRAKIVISDERMPGMDGSAFLSAVKEQYPETVRIMLTGNASLESAMKAVNCGEIYRFLTKPWQDLELKLAIASAIEKFDLEEENRRLLRTIRNQAVEIKLLERQFPGIARHGKNAAGVFVLPDISDDDLAAIIAEFEKKY